MPQTADAALGRVVSVDARARRCLFVGVIGDIRGLAEYNMKLPTPGGVRPLGVRNGRYGFSSASSQAWRLRYNDGVTDWRFPVCGSGSLGWPCLYFAPLSSIRSDLVRSHHVGGPPFWGGCCSPDGCSNKTVLVSRLFQPPPARRALARFHDNPDRARSVHQAQVVGPRRETRWTKVRSPTNPAPVGNHRA
jgi:hypothetical protein